MKKDNAIVIPSRKCECGKTMNRTIAADGEGVPTAGCPSVCIYCGKISVFKDDLSQGEPTDADVAEWKKDPKFYAQLMHVRDVIVKKYAI